MYAGVRTPILLQMVKVCVSRAEPNLSLDTRVIFDCGSQRSYVTNQLKSSLSLPVRSADTSMIKTFGSNEEQVQTCDVVDMLLKTREGKNL